MPTMTLPLTINGQSVEDLPREFPPPVENGLIKPYVPPTEASDDDDDEETVECWGTGDTVPRDEAVEHDGNWYLQSYYDDHFGMCEHCQDSFHESDLTPRYDGADDEICDRCLDRHYFSCHGCEEYYPNDDANNINDNSMCSSCAEGYYYCEGCNSHCHDQDWNRDYDCCQGCEPEDEGEDGNGNYGLDLEPTMPDFVIRGASGDIAPKQKVSVRIDGRKVTSEDFWAAYSYIQNELDICMDFDDIGHEYVKREGKITKRIEKWLKEFGKKPTKQQIDKIGTLLTRNLPPEQVDIDFTRHFDWKAGDFGDSGSCYWSCRKLARQQLAKAGGIAIRSYKQDGIGNARAWLIPGRIAETPDPTGLCSTLEYVRRTKVKYKNGCRLLTPCGLDYEREEYWGIEITNSAEYQLKLEIVQDPTEAEFWVVFNGYGHGTKGLAEAFARLMGLKAEKSKLLNNDSQSGLIWINDDGNGYVVGSDEILEKLDGLTVDFKIPGLGKYSD